MFLWNALLPVGFGGDVSDTDIADVGVVDVPLDGLPLAWRESVLIINKKEKEILWI